MRARALRRRLSAAGVALLIGATAHAVRAHDQWLEPEVSGRGERGGATLRARLVVGESPFYDEDKPFERVKLSRLELVSRNGGVDLRPTGIEGSRPLASAAGLGDGEFVLVADRAPVLIELAPEKFESYLTEEGLTSIVGERAARGESRKIGRERYTRYTKALVRVGPPVTHGMAAKTVGQRLEIVIDGALAPIRPGDPLGVRVTFDGRPLAGAKLQASLRRAGVEGNVAGPTADAGVPNASAPSGGSVETTHTTDARGRAVVTPPAAGLLVLHLVHMRRCMEAAGAPCADADWESFWGSFSAPVE